MTVATNKNKDVYNGDGLTTTFPITFPTSGIVASEIKVYITDALGVSTEITTNFTIDLSALTVEYPTSGSPLPTGQQIVILRELPYTQTTDLKNQGNLNAEALEQTYDRIVYLCQQIREVLDRVPVGDVSADEFDTDALIAQAEVQADAAAASAAAAATSETNAAASEANAATSETNAATSETNAASSAAAAASSAAEGLYNDVVSKAFADSPIVPLLSEEGTLYKIDTSGGNVVVNLSALSTYGEDMKFAFVKTTSDANTITINRGGTDTIEGGTSYTLDTQWTVIVLVGDSATGSWLAAVQSSVEIASEAEAKAGTNNTKMMTPLRTKQAKVEALQLLCFDYTEDIAVGDGCGYIHIPSSIDGMNLSKVHAEIINPEPSYTKLSLHFNGSAGSTTMIDSSPSAHTVTAYGTAQIADVSGSFGGKTLSLDGNSDYLSIPYSSDWDFAASASDNWTIDCWIYSKAISGTQTLYNQTTSAGWGITLNSDSSLQLFVYNGGYYINATTAGGLILANTWYHIAVIKVADKYGVYIDGVQKAYDQSSSTFTSTQPFIIGKYGDSNIHYFNGYIDELRIQKANPFSASPNSGLTDTITIPSETTDIQLYRMSSSPGDMLSTKLTIDFGDSGSDTASTPAVINQSYAAVAENDMIRVDCDAISESSKQGLLVTMEFENP